MFLFLLNTEVINNARRDVKTGSTYVPDPTIFPDDCYTKVDISTEAIYETKLEKDKKHCFLTYGSIFVNGDPVKITGYKNKVQKMSDKGNFATLATDKVGNVMALESDEDQDVSIVGSFYFGKSSKVYISTKNTVKKVDLLKDASSADFNYYGNLVLLGPKKSVKIETDLDFHSSGTINAPNRDPISVPSNEKHEETLGYVPFIWINAMAPFDDNEFEVEIDATGDDWKVPMDGLVDIVDGYVYQESDFVASGGGLSAGAIAGIAVGCVVFVAILITVCCCCCCKKKKKVSQESSSDGKKSKKQKTETVVVQQQVQPMPPMYPDQPTVMVQPQQPAMMQPQPMMMQQQPMMQQQQMMMQQQPMMMQPQPVMIQQQPVMMQPQPVMIQQQPVMMQPQPMMMQPQPMM